MRVRFCLLWVQLPSDGRLLALQLRAKAAKAHGRSLKLRLTRRRLRLCARQLAPEACGRLLPPSPFPPEAPLRLLELGPQAIDGRIACAQLARETCNLSLQPAERDRALALRRLQLPQHTRRDRVSLCHQAGRE